MTDYRWYSHLIKEMNKLTPTKEDPDPKDDPHDEMFPKPKSVKDK